MSRVKSGTDPEVGDQVEFEVGLGGVDIRGSGRVRDVRPATIGGKVVEVSAETPPAIAGCVVTMRGADVRVVEAAAARGVLQLAPKNSTAPAVAPAAPEPVRMTRAEWEKAKNYELATDPLVSRDAQVVLGRAATRLDPFLHHDEDEAREPPSPILSRFLGAEALRLLVTAAQLGARLTVPALVANSLENEVKLYEALVRWQKRLAAQMPGSPS